MRLCIVVIFFILATVIRCSQDFKHVYTLEQNRNGSLETWKKGSARPIGPPYPRNRAPSGYESYIVRVREVRATPDEEEECVCVEYWMCDAKTNRIIPPEELATRLQKKTCPGVQVCCLPITPASQQPMQESEPTEEIVRGPTEVNIIRPTQRPIIQPTQGPIIQPTEGPIIQPTEGPIIQPTQGPIIQPSQKPTADFPGCGYRHQTTNNGPFDTRIQNTDDVNTHFAEFPWMLALLRMVDDEKIFVCGASLIDYKVVLTAAHCVYKLDKSELQVRGGVWNLQEDNDTLPHQERYVTDIIIHPEFKSGSLFNDVALLFLNEPISKSSSVNVICLPHKDMQVDTSKCVAAGWGRDKFGPKGRFQDAIKKVELSIIPRDTCEAKLRTTRLGEYFKLHESFLCAGGEPGKDTCQGDGGGPLVCPFTDYRSLGDDNGERFLQMGIVAWGIGCGEEGVPGVYADVSVQEDWINDNIWKAHGINISK